MAMTMALWAGACAAADPAPCRVKGVAHEALCGSVARALDPIHQNGVQIDVHYAVLPALARNKLPDPVFFLAGGPGQSAIDLAGPLAALFTRLNNRRDLVFVDQRGTGRSAPLQCDRTAEAMRPLAERFDEDTQLARLAECRERLTKLPYGDLRFYGTSLAMGDVEAVRVALAAPRIDLVGASYGTRAALEYVRQYPQAVRRVVLDGVAPSDMVLPASFAIDNQAALDGLFEWCARDAACRRHHPGLRAQWIAWLDSLPRDVTLKHPFTSVDESLRLTRGAALSMVRAALYAPALASALPQAIAEASAGRLAPLVGLSSALGGAGGELYVGMHFSVVCSEDLGRGRAGAPAQGGEFGAAFLRLYERACANWPRGVIDPAFDKTPVAPVATWLLSGGADPATPPRHAERIAQVLGAKARHTVVPQAGHGVMQLPCLREAIQHFIDAASDDDALRIDATCANGVPRPPLFVPIGTVIGGAR